MKYETFSSPEADKLEKKVQEMLTSWNEMVEESGLTDEYRDIFLTSLKRIPERFKNTSFFKDREMEGLLTAIRYVLIDDIQKHLLDALRALSRNKQTGEKIVAPKNQLDAANLYNLLIEDSHNKEAELIEKHT